MNLKIGNAQGHCYDGASIMAGSKSGFATQLKSEFFFTHCYEHVLNLVASDIIRHFYHGIRDT